MHTMNPKRLGRRLGGGFACVLAAFGRTIRTRFFSNRERPPLYEGTILDDLLWGQVFNPIMRVLWWWGRRRRGIRPGVSVVIVSWNTRDILESTVTSIRRHSPADTAIIVIDNGSTDGSREWIKAQASIDRCVLLPFNIGHGRGLDMGFALAKTDTVVTLDSDAFPFADHWLDVLRDPLRDDSIDAVGMWGRRDRLHPACAAIKRRSFYDARTTCNNHAPWLDRGEEPEFGVNSWDTAELLFERLGRDRVILHPVERSEHGGITMCDAVYHHEQMTTVQTDMPAAVGAERRDLWDRAVADLLQDVS